jgi:predicted ester cyclase
MSGSAEQRKAADRVVFEVWSTGEVDRLDAIVSADVVHHDPYDRHASEGLDGLKRAILGYRRAFPDARFTVEDQVAEGDKVVEAWRNWDALALLSAIGVSRGEPGH